MQLLGSREGGGGGVGAVQEVLPIELVHEDEDVVDADGEHEEGDDLGDDERAFHA